MELIFNTELAIRSLGIKIPPARQAKAATNCMFCGRPIAAGGECEPVKIARGSFMDDAWFAARSGIACPNCMAMNNSSVAKKLGSANCIVYTRDGAFPIAKDAHRTWFLLTPPEGPFVATASGTINFQHVVWKVPTSYSPELIYIAWPTRIMTIRHSILMQAVKVCKEVSDQVLALKQAAEAADSKKKKPIKTMTHPFISLDRNLTDLNHGVIRPDVLALVSRSSDLADRIEFLKGLSLGETWGLATLAKGTPEEPVKPEPLFIEPNVLINQ